MHRARIMTGDLRCMSGVELAEVYRYLLERYTHHGLGRWDQMPAMYRDRYAALRAECRMRGEQQLLPLDAA